MILDESIWVVFGRVFGYLWRWIALSWFGDVLEPDKLGFLSRNWTDKPVLCRNFVAKVGEDSHVSLYIV